MASDKRGAASKLLSLHRKDTAMPARPSPHQNHLLDALPASDYARLLSHLELITMPLGEVLYEPGGRLQHVYFPITSIVSLLYVMEDGASAEIAVVGTCSLAMRNHSRASLPCRKRWGTFWMNA